jgi:hypothetical protein
MTKKAVFLISSFFLLLGWFMYQVGSFSLFGEERPRLLKQIALPRTHQQVNVYTVASNATVQPGILLRDVTAGKNSMIGFYAGYTTLQEHSTTNRNLHMHLRDTTGRRPDSLFTLPL